MFSGKNFLDGSLPIKRFPLSVWCDALMGRQAAFAGVVARVEALRGRMSEAGRQVEGLFESLLAQAFVGGR